MQNRSLITPNDYRVAKKFRLNKCDVVLTLKCLSPFHFKKAVRHHFTTNIRSILRLRLRTSGIFSQTPLQMRRHLCDRSCHCRLHRSSAVWDVPCRCCFGLAGYTMSLIIPHSEWSQGVRSGERAGHAILPPRPIHDGKTPLRYWRTESAKWGGAPSCCHTIDWNAGFRCVSGTISVSISR